jgi:hypothetical protein
LITVGIASMDRPAWDFVESLWQLQAPEGETLRMTRQGPLAVDVARNEVVRAFLQQESEWLLMVDADAKLHPQTLLRLLSWDQPVVGALCFQRYGPCMPTVMRGQVNDTADSLNALYGTQVGEIREWILAHPMMVQSGPVMLEPAPEDALTQVDRTGCHCLLIHRRVLEAIPDPWFVGNPMRRHTQEDMTFCDAVRAAGFPIYVDRSVVAAHLYGDRPLGALDFVVWDSVSDYGDQPQPTVNQR